MKIAVSAGSDSLDSQVNPTFGRCNGFIIVETDGSEIKKSKFVQNTAMNASGGAGISAAQIVIDQGVKAVISGNLGPNAFTVLNQAGVKFYPASGLNIRDAIKKLSEGSLAEKAGASVSQNFGSGMGLGRGMGRGRGAGKRVWQK